MTKQEVQEFIRVTHGKGDEWTEEQVLDVYGNWTLEKAIEDRLTCLEMHAKNLAIAKEHGLL